MIVKQISDKEKIEEYNKMVIFSIKSNQKAFLS